MRDEPVETIEYRGHDINIFYDCSPLNPWTDWDCELPILVAYLDHARMNLRSYGVSEHMPHLERHVVMAHWREMLAEMDIRNDWQGLLSFARDELRYPRDPLDRVLATAFEEHFNDLSADDKLELLETVYGWLGITAVLGSTTGYSQGDYATVLAVATSEWAEEVGAPADSLKSQCEHAIKLYGWWAWGDVFGYVIDEDGDSCWGYYGDEHEKSGLLYDAQSAINYMIKKHVMETDTEALTCD